MSQIFSPKIVTKTPSRNRFPLSYYNRVTTRMGDLTPVLCKKVLPGDRWRVGLSSITRLTPLANPVYDRVRITFDAFFVQNRIIDPDWKAYVSPDPEAASNPSTGMTMTGSFLKISSPESEDFSFGPVFRRNFRRGIDKRAYNTHCHIIRNNLKVKPLSERFICAVGVSIGNKEVETFINSIHSNSRDASRDNFLCCHN